MSEALPGCVVVTLWVIGPKGWASSTWLAHDALGGPSSISISASWATLVEYSSVDDKVEKDSIEASRVGVVSSREEGRPLWWLGVPVVVEVENVFEGGVGLV